MNQDITKSLGGHFGLRSHSQAFSIRGIMTGKNHCGMARGKGIPGRVRLVYSFILVTVLFLVVALQSVSHV